MRTSVYFVNRFFYPDNSATSLILSGVAFDLARQGHDVHVITSRQRYEDAAAGLPEFEVVNGVTIHRVGSTHFGRTGLRGRAVDYCSFAFNAARLLNRIVRAEDTVVAKTDPPLLALAIAPVARLRGARFVNWIQDVFPEVAGAAGIGGRLVRAAMTPLKYLRNWTLVTAHQNVAIGEQMAGHLRRQGVKPDRLTVIPNWADPAVVHLVTHDANTLRKEWGLTGKFVVGYSGNLGRVHDVATIITAIDEIQRRGVTDRSARNIEFVFVGGGVLRRELESEIEKRGITNVQLRPYQPHERLAEALALADIHLVSLRPEMEGFVVPSKFYGIAAAGRPTVFIGAEDGEIAAVVRRHGCGLAVKVGDGEALSTAIMALATDVELRHAMGQRAREAFETTFAKSFASLNWHALLRAGSKGASVSDAGFASGPEVDWQHVREELQPIAAPTRATG